MASDLNLLTLTAQHAQELLQARTITSVDLVDAYLSQIDAHNHSGLHLNALISIVPRERLLATASTLDEERRTGKVRGPLHGIPIVFKDVFAMEFLPTSAGAPCFLSAKAKRTAPLVSHCLNAGMIVLGSGNLTEFCGLKHVKPVDIYKGLRPGFSAAGGQTQSPYIYGGIEKDEKAIGHSSIGGSSSGTASSVAAGFAPFGVGTECCGSLMLPASRGGLYALKCGLNKVSAEGAFHYTDDLIDFIGGMAKNVNDLNHLTCTLMQRPQSFDVSAGLQGLTIAFTDASTWRIPDSSCSWPEGTRESVEEAYRGVIQRLGQHGATIQHTDLEPPWEAFKYKEKSIIYETALYQLSNKSMQTFIDEFDDCEVSSVRDIIEWNEKHAEQCLPDKHTKQDELEYVVNNQTTKEEYDIMVSELRRRGEEGLGKLLESADIVVALADGPLCIYTTAIACPIATVPMSMVKYSDRNERPVGLCAAARDEGTLLRFMAAYEAISPPRLLPKPLLHS